MKNSEIYERVLENLTPDTWIQGELTDGNGGYCAFGHIINACAQLGEERYSGASDEAEAAERLEDRVGRVISIWNDDSHTSFEDVVLEFKQAYTSALEEEV